MTSTLLLAVVLAPMQGAAPPSESVRRDAEGLAPALLALFDYDREADLDIQERGSEPYEGLEKIDLSYASPMGGRVPAYLYMPTDEAPKAGLIMMHGMPGSRDNSSGMAERYARAGAVVLAISAPWARPDGGEPVTFTERDRQNQIQLIQDLRRGVDLLLTFPWVDPQRIGYCGGSYGGAMGGLLAGVEHRIKAYVLAVGDGGLYSHFTSPGDEIPPEGIERSVWEAWVAAMEPIEPIHFVRHAAPSELLFQNGRTDQLVPEADGRAYQEAGSEPKTTLWYDDGHSISEERLRDQARWLGERIGIDAEAFVERRTERQTGG